MKSGQLFRLHRRASLIFAFIVFFLIAQVSWWLIFFSRYSNKSADTQFQGWVRDQQAMIYAYRSLSVMERRKLVGMCKRYYLYLNCHLPHFPIRVEARGALLDQKRRYQRMLLFEGTFFLIAMICGLLLLAFGIRTEKELRRRQQNFISAVSHELRTPISTMRLLLESLILRRVPESKQPLYLQRLEKQLDRLQKNCERVLCAARLEEVQPKERFESRELNKEITELIDEGLEEWKEKGGEISFRPLKDEVYVYIEPMFLAMIFHNLVENALKYNSKVKKKVTITVQVKDNYAQFQVEDDGMGISVSERRKVFDAFYRVGNEMTRESTGLGLGLYLVKSLSEVMFGFVRYEPLDEGSRFIVYLPRVSAPTKKS